MPRGSCGAGQGSRSALSALSIKHVKPTWCSKVNKDLGFGLKVQNCKTVPFRRHTNAINDQKPSITVCNCSPPSAKLQEAQMVRPNTRAWRRGPWGSLALVKVVGVWIWVEDRKAKISVLQLGLRSWLYETLAQSNHQNSNPTGSKLHIYISILSPYAP